MILYNRAAFDKRNINKLLDTCIEAESKLKGNQSPLAEEAIVILKMALETTVAKHENMDLRTTKGIEQATKRIDELLESRKAELSQTPKTPKPK